MELENIVQTLKRQKTGTFQRIVVRRECKTRKGSPSVTKRSTFQRLANVHYANRFFVKLGVSLGLRKAPKLPEWAESIYIDGIRLVRHKASGELYLPVNVEGMTARVEWFLNGEPSTFETVSPYLLASELAEKESKAELSEKFQAVHKRIKLTNLESLE